MSKQTRSGASLGMAEVSLSFPFPGVKRIGGIYWREGHTVFSGKWRAILTFGDSPVEGRSLRLASSTRSNHPEYGIRHTVCSVGETTTSS